MRRLPAIAFVALVAATVAAFFITQHLKVSTPLIASPHGPSPAVIDPLYGGQCGDPPVDHRRTSISFFLQHRSDDVDVYVVDQNGSIVRTLASGRHMQGGAHAVRTLFSWNGREDSGRVAPGGTYYIRVALIHQGRTVTIADGAGHPRPVTVTTSPPAPVVTQVAPKLIPARTPVTISYAGNEGRSATVEIYRTDVPGRPRLVKRFVTRWGARSATWDGRIRKRPAAAGTYLVGLDVTDAACVTGRFPHKLPPAPGSTPHAGVTVRYLAAQPPLDPVLAGARATVLVDSRKRSYSWTLVRIGKRRPLASGRSTSFALSVPLASTQAGLYELALRSGSHSTTVPLVARARRGARVLVVLPALTWQGLNPVDDDGDGFPNTLSGGQRVALARPLVDGLPAGFADEAGLLSYLDASHHAYDLTTDLGLIDGVGPRLRGHSLVILAGDERWLPYTLLSAVHSYVAGGGHLVSFGIGSLLREVTVRAGEAQDPTPPAPHDPLGAAPGPVVTHNHELIGVLADGLGIFTTTSGVFTGFASYQPFGTSALNLASEAGVSSTVPAIIGYRLRGGTVVDIALPGFGSRLAGNVDAKELLGQVWTVLAR
jgi:N,N-dimethylformamidase beta subunit-like, C-terminal/FlgD Ig-like domain